MEGKRGTRTRVTDQSLTGGGNPLATPPLGAGGEGSRSGGTQSGAEGTSSESQNDGSGGNGAAGGDHPERTANRNASTESHDDGGGSSSTELGGEPEPTGKSSFDHSPEEAAEWNKLKQQNAQLLQRKGDADRKITEQGTELSSARKENEQMTGRMTQLEGTVTKLAESVNGFISAQQNGGQRSRRSVDASYGNDFENLEEDEGSGAADDARGSQVEQDVAGIKRVLGGIFGRQKEFGDQFGEFQAERERERDLSHVQQELGVNREAAETILDAHATGDISSVYKAIELTAFPAEARRQARTERERHRNSVFQPATTGGSTFTPTESDTAMLKDRAEKIVNMPDGTNKQRVTEDFFENYPGAFEALREASGFNV
jgi:hypothetical protein